LLKRAASPSPNCHLPHGAGLVGHGTKQKIALLNKQLLKMGGQRSVSPSYNQLETTIRSILLQGYPKLEYFIENGQSRNETRDLDGSVAKYRLVPYDELDRLEGSIA